MKNYTQITTQVKIRKYPLDTRKLQELLRASKKQIGISNKQISNILNVPTTQVEHWFRTDKCFSAPPAQHWKTLKKLLCINSNEFDDAITTYEIRDGKFDMSNRLYHSNNIAPTITCECGNINILVGNKSC